MRRKTWRVVGVLAGLISVGLLVWMPTVGVSIEALSVPRDGMRSAQQLRVGLVIVLLGVAVPGIARSRIGQGVAPVCWLSQVRYRLLLWYGVWEAVFALGVYV